MLTTIDSRIATFSCFGHETVNLSSNLPPTFMVWFKRIPCVPGGAMAITSHTEEYVDRRDFERVTTNRQNASINTNNKSVLKTVLSVGLLYVKRRPTKIW